MDSRRTAVSDLPDCWPALPLAVWKEMCMECGHVGCCDSSKNRHATKHFHQTKHAIIRSIEPGETWTWCYLDGVEGELGRGL